MKISTRGRYGLRALIDVSLHEREGRVSLSDISQRQDLSVNYLESIFAVLKRGGVVSGTAGAQGGYVLARPAEEISLLSILNLLDGDLRLSAEPGDDEPRMRHYLRSHVWRVMEQEVKNALAGITLRDITPQEKEKTRWND